MAYEYAEKAGNVAMIDAHMFGFDRFQACYLVAGQEVALVDTGVPPSLEFVREGIKACGVAIKDIAHIFVTHAEHPDHGGCVGLLLQENSRAKVYVSPAGVEYLTNPEIEAAKRKANLSAAMAARFGEMVPVPRSRIQVLEEGDSFNLGGGEKLRIMLTPGHQPGGIVIYEEKNTGLFINDLCGAYFADTGASWIFTPFRADVRQYLMSLKRVIDMPLKKLYLGHFGISDKPQEVLKNALAKVQQLIGIAAGCRAKTDPQEIFEKVMAIRMPEAEKMRAARGKSFTNT